MTTDPGTCSECGGMWLYGAPLEHSTSSHDGVVTDLYWCVKCCEYVSSACWPDDKWGPYPHKITHWHEGHA